LTAFYAHIDDGPVLNCIAKIHKICYYNNNKYPLPHLSMKKTSSSHYQRLVAGFAASAFALLGMLSMQQYEANQVTADVAERPTVMTNYRSSKNCIVIKGQRNVQQNNFRVCRPVR
jgi:hypothetical protein